MADFKKGRDPKEAMSIGNPSIKTKIARVLRNMYEDYINKKTLRKLENYELTPAYLRKVVGSEVVIRTTKSKRDMQYKWNGGDNPDFDELADRVLAFSTHTKAKKEFPGAIYTSKLSLLLYKEGVAEEKIPHLTEEIMKLFFPE